MRTTKEKAITSQIPRVLLTMLLAAGAMLTTTTASAAEACGGTAWAEGMTFKPGDVVSFNGHNYRILQPHTAFVGTGWTPVAAPALWTDLGTCSANSNGEQPGQKKIDDKQGDPGSPQDDTHKCKNSPLLKIKCDEEAVESGDFPITQAQFNQMFPNRNALYTYAGMMDARKKFKTFGTTGSETVRKQEVAAFFANVAHETGELVYAEEIAKSDYCDPSNTPCTPGKQYFGRGPIQLSWNYNYSRVGTILNLPLLQRPELVSSDSSVAWQTSIYFWMMEPGAGTRPPHVTMVGKQGFGDTIRSINGALECNGGRPEQVSKRVTYYKKFTEMLGVPAGDNISC